MVRFSVTPEVNAASALLILVTVVLTSVALYLQNRMTSASGNSPS
jgi:spermidine/putrescine transport system permease protein